MDKIKTKIEEYDAFFQTPQEKSFELSDGRGAVMISAPHSAEHLRNGVVRCAEPQTGVLARLLHDELHCPVIYKTKNCNDDANFDKASPYKKALVDYVKSNGVKFVIDLHQLSPERDVMVDLGTSNFRNVNRMDCLNVILGEFTSKKLGQIQLDAPFGALGPYTVSSYIRRRCNVQTIQIEINSRLLYGKQADVYFEKVFSALRNTVVALNEILGSKNEK